MNKKLLKNASFPRKRESSFIKQAWINVSQQRLADILSKKVTTIPYEQVFDHIDQRLGL